MIPKTNPIHAIIICPCTACLGTEINGMDLPCESCDGEGEHRLHIASGSVESLREDALYAAYDTVSDIVDRSGREVDDRALKYEIVEEGWHTWNEWNGKYEIRMAIVRHPVSRETADAMNALVRK